MAVDEALHVLRYIRQRSGLHTLWNIADTEWNTTIVEARAKGQMGH